MSEKGLGRGLDSLLGGTSYEDFNSQETSPWGTTEEKFSQDSQSNQDSQGSQSSQSSQVVREVDIEKVSANPDQPRKEFDENSILELSESIKEKGILQPILVEETAEGNFFIIAGERRYRASKQAKLDKIPVIVKEFANEQERLEVALIENIQRENLSPIEEAEAYKALMELGTLSQENVAKKVGKKRSTVANALRLLKLPKHIQKTISDGDLSPGHARAILSVLNPADQELLYNKIITNNLSVRDAEKFSQDLNNGDKSFTEEKKKPAPKAQQLSPELAEIEQKFINTFGTKVQIKGNLKAGKVEIYYYSQDDLDKVYDTIIGEDD